MADFETLYRKFIDQTCTEQEKEALFAMIMNEENDARLFQMMDRVIDEPHVVLQVDDRKADHLLQGLLTQLPDRKKKRGKLVTIAGWAAAAVIAGIGVTYLMQPQRKTSNIQSQQAMITKDPLPAVNGAVLTLGDGSQVVLDSLQKGVIANQGGTHVSLAQGTVSYDAQSAASVSYNTLNTPKGRLFHLVLPDGTDVWLNAASAITYPTSFTGNNRTVTLKGEAYFDVKQNAEKPFIVQLANSTQVQVLGTTFNINAYENESSIATTLITGSVKVNDRLLKPGDQASVRYDAAAMQVMRADTSQVLAWKNGIFNFENADIQSVMKQLERWYDIEAQYENGIPILRFGGKMDRNLSLSNILRMLEISGVQCRLEGRKLIIRQ